MPQPSNSIYYNGMYYEIVELKLGTWLWIVYDFAGTRQTEGIATSYDIAWQSVKDWIDAASGYEGDIGDPLMC